MGWSADEAASFTVMDGFAEAGGNFLDTSDIYSIAQLQESLAAVTLTLTPAQVRHLTELSAWRGG